MHPALLNGHVRCTLIETFNGDVIVIRPGFKQEFGRDLQAARKFIEDSKWEISVAIIKGSPVQRKIQQV